MAVISGEKVISQASGFGSLPALRQLGLMAGLALSVALGVTVAMWSQTPNYSMLYGGLSAKELALATQALDSSNIKYQIDSGSGAIMVAADRAQDARLKLAASNLSFGAEIGFEILDKEQGFGSSSFLQKARYNRAIEGELAQSVSKLNFVKSARVHIAIPKQSVFARLNAKPSVSVVLNLHPGRVLDEMQVQGIVSMVASSVPELEAEMVSVIDQKGRLLSGKSGDKNMLTSSTQFEYRRNLEEHYVNSIIDIISPMVGLGGIRAQVVADIDFTSQELTKESYLPDQTVLRSEQVYEENSGTAGGVSGVPGALSNQPPAGGSTEINQTGGGNQNTNNKTMRATRNYELDRTISHTRQAPTTVRRLSVAVVIDYRSETDETGKVTKTALTADELQRITALIKESVGLSDERGDTINVVNTPFQAPEKVEDLPEIPLWELPWVLALAKQLLGGLAVLLIAFGVLRPMMNKLASNDQAKKADSKEGGGDDQLTLGNSGPIDIKQLKELAGTIARDDPKRVAQVMNTWVADDE